MTSQVSYPCLNSENSPVIVKVMCVMLTFQSLYYIEKMYHILKRKWRQKSERNHKNIHFEWFTEDDEELQNLSYFRRVCVGEKE